MKSGNAVFCPQMQKLSVRAVNFAISQKPITKKAESRPTAPPR